MIHCLCFVPNFLHSTLWDLAMLLNGTVVSSFSSLYNISLHDNKAIYLFIILLVNTWGFQPGYIFQSTAVSILIYIFCCLSIHLYTRYILGIELLGYSRNLPIYSLYIASTSVENTNQFSKSLCQFLYPY